MELTKNELTSIMNILAATPSQNLQVASELLNLYNKVKLILDQDAVVTKSPTEEPAV